ncbi:hypothetical protein GGH92_007487 [Coemansia sp. RSA 2673]|nr:hypothetical protein GGH92_007487 [Coemansia sp. RSA 2673]
MEQTDEKVARVLSALQGRFAGHTIHQTSLPSSPSKSGAEGNVGSDRQPKVWVIPAGVGSDLTRPATLAALVAQWTTLEESQKINAILGIAHVGQNKMRPVRSSVLELATLAKADNSDWVRVLGCTLGDVGVTGKMTRVADLESGSAERAGIEAGVEQLYLAALAKLPELKLTAGVLPYVSARVAEATAPPAIRNVYGDRPSARLLAQILARAEAEVAEEAEKCAAHGNTSARRASAAVLRTLSPHPPATEVAGPVSAPMSHRGSPEPNDPATADFSDLFGDSDGDGVDVDEPASRMALHVRSSHRADHIGRMRRLLTAAAPAPAEPSHTPVPTAIDTRRPSLGRPQSGIASGPNSADLAARRPSRGGVTPSAAPSTGGRKIGMLAPRRRTAPTNAALPGVGLGTAAARRGLEAAGGNGAPSEQPKILQKVNVEDAGAAMQARDRLVQEKREKLVEEREAKRLKRQADVNERKRKREEEAEKKKAAAAEKRPALAKRGRPRGSTSRNKSRDISAEVSSGNESEDSAKDSSTMADDDDVRSPTGRSTRGSPVGSRQNVYIPPQEYRTFAGNDPQIRAVYANTNALNDQDRLLMYCFFNAYPAPPDAPQKLSIVLNEEFINDPNNPGKMCKEVLVLEADCAEGTWSKMRRKVRG